MTNGFRQKDSSDSKWELVFGSKRRKNVLWQMKAKINTHKILVKVNQKNYQLIAMDKSSLNYITISLVVFINFISFKLSFVHPHMTAISDILGCYQNGNISF